MGKIAECPVVLRDAGVMAGIQTCTVVLELTTEAVFANNGLRVNDSVLIVAYGMIVRHHVRFHHQ
jgi:hypothetical protein